MNWLVEWWLTAFSYWYTFLLISGIIMVAVGVIIIIKMVREEEASEKRYREAIEYREKRERESR